MFIKDNILVMMIDDLFGIEIKTEVPFMVIRVAKEDGQCRTRSKVMRGTGGEVGLTGATKDTKMIVHRS